MVGYDLVWKAVRVAYRKWGAKGVVAMAAVGGLLYLVWTRRLESFVEEETAAGGEGAPGGA